MNRYFSLLPLALTAVGHTQAVNPGGGGGAAGGTIPTTTSILKGDGAGNAAAAAPGTDYPTVATVAGKQNAPLYITGASAIYELMPSAISGTTVIDSSGNGRNATANAGVSSDAFGVVMTSSGAITLPAVLNSDRTHEIAFELPSNITIAMPDYVTLIGGNPGSNGPQILLEADFAGNQGFASSYGLDTYVNSTIMATNITLPYGPHVIVWTQGTSSGDPDVYYLDGIPYQFYVKQGFSANQQTSGNVILGASINSVTVPGIKFRKYISRAAELTAAQVAQESGALAADMVARGLTWKPVTFTSRTPRLMAFGNSYTTAINIPTTNQWTDPSQLVFASTTPPFLRVPVAETAALGYTAFALNGTIPGVVDKYCRQSAGAPNLAIQWEHTNDFASLSGITVEQVASDALTAVNLFKAAGCVPAVGTMISHTGNDKSGTAYDTDKNNLNPVLRNRVKGAGAILIDFAADPRLGADGAYNNTTYFQSSDHVHLTAAGETILAQEAAQAIDYYFGYSDSNPHAYTASATMGANDGSTSWTCTATCAATLPSCIGQSGAIYRVANVGAVGMTVITNTAAQTINGQNYSTGGTGVQNSGNGMPLGANTVLKLLDVPNPSNVGGCTWLVQ